jgi:uncharacterized protein YoxC
MDLTLFIVIISLIIVIIYLINTVNSLKKDIKNLNACANVKDNPDNNEKMIDTFKNGLEYLKNFL